MSLLSIPVVADTAARVLQRLPDLRRPSALDFPEIPGAPAMVQVPTRHGDVPCSVYLPPDPPPGGPAVYVNAHGGGFVIAHPEQDDPWCRYLAARGGVAVVNVDYGVAPEHRFPMAVEQVFDVVRWAAQPGHAWDGARLVVGGQSAGGSLAAGAARLALEAGGPAIALQVLHYPPLDLVTPARDKPAPHGRTLLTPWMGEIFDTAYVPDPEQRRDRLASPAWGPNAEGIAGIAPALVITCAFDRLRAEGVRYAHALGAVGALVEHHDVAGADHGYTIVGGTRELAERMYGVIVGHVRRATA